MTATFESLNAGDTIDGPKFAVSRESIRLFCDASLDYNPLHLDDDYMKGNFGKTNFGGIIMHGMNNFGLISRMITDWAYPAGAVHRRLETRWVKPVRPGDTIQPTGIVKSKQATANSRWVLIDVMVRNQNDEKVATGEAMVEFPIDNSACNFKPEPPVEHGNGSSPPRAAKSDPETPVWIDIRPCDGLETARPGRHSRQRDQARFATFGLSEHGLSKHQDCPMKVRNSLKSLRGRHRNNRLVRRKGRVYVINKVSAVSRRARVEFRPDSGLPGRPRKFSPSRVFDAFAALQRVFLRLDFVDGTEIPCSRAPA